MMIMEDVKPPREYFFKKGNKYATGKPPSSKKQMEVIRRRVLAVVKRRLFHEKDLKTVSTTDLLKFVATIMPKDYALAVKPEVNYISNVPREEDALPEPAPAQTLIEDVVVEDKVLDEQPIVEEVPKEEPSASQTT